MTDLSALDRFKDQQPVSEEAEFSPETKEDLIVPIVKNRKILSFDQSLANTGYVLLFDMGISFTGNLKAVEKLSGHQGTLNRVVPLYNEVYAVIAQMNPDLVVYETPPAGGRMMRPESSLMAATVLEIAAAKLLIPTVMIGAQKAKKRFTGNGNAKKAEVREVIKRLDPSVMTMKPMNEAIFDSIAIGWVACETIGEVKYGH